MLVDEFDGFVTGLLVCLELIKLGEWLSHVWGAGEGEEPVFGNLDTVNAVLGLVMEHCNDVATLLFERPDRYAPLFAVDPNSGEILWECWIEGFEKAVKLRPHAWRGFLDPDRETAAPMSGLLMLADVARADPRFSKQEIDAITATAHERIGGWILTLNEWRLANDAPPNIPAPLPSASTRRRAVAKFNCRRRRMGGMANVRRSARNDRINRHARMVACRSGVMSVGVRVRSGARLGWL